MNSKSSFIVLVAVIFGFSLIAQPTKQIQKEKSLAITFIKKEADRKIDVMVGEKLFTSYCWFENTFKQVLFPVFTSAGTEITRGFPLQQRAGERNDHPHQFGIWLTYGDVNGNDFWGNGSLGLGRKNANGGTIKHVKVDKLSEGRGEGILVASAIWCDSTGHKLLSEHSEYHFIAKGSIRIIDRITTLTATSTKVTFKDTKEGMFGIRVARQLELPSKEDVVLTDAKGNPTKVKAMSNRDVSGNYKSSEGISGEAVWGTRAKWMNLYGTIGNEKISLIVCDHPKNQSFPTFWHARGYGLFAANPLGAKDFTKGKEEVNFSLPSGSSTTFRYRVIVTSGTHLTDSEIQAYADEFAGSYE